MSDVQFTSNLGAVQNATEDTIRRALEIIGGMAETNVKAITPVDTGNLRNSITHRVDGVSVYIGTNVEYAPFVELGHRARNGKKVNPKPFLRPGIEDNMDQYRGLLEAMCGTIT